MANPILKFSLLKVPRIVDRFPVKMSYSYLSIHAKCPKRTCFLTRVDPYSSAFGEMSQTDVFFNANCPVLECFRIIFDSKLILTDDRRTDRRQTDNRQTNREFRELPTQ